MQLWTEYEGVIIDGAFPLHKLLSPEGRSAFFSTAGPTGEPTVVRLIECHFDEEEILARWRCVEALNHPNFLQFERYGRISLDGCPVVYAVFEKVDANLAEVLDQGHLSVRDVAQLTFSLSAALDVLHSHGFIHEHIEPHNIFAAGEVIKLRGDCIREAPEGEEGRVAKQRDFCDLVTVLLQALTRQRSLENVPDSAVPPPFGQIIRNGLDGTWGLGDIRAAVQDLSVSAPRKAQNPVRATAAPPATVEPKATDHASNRVSSASSSSKAQLSLPLYEARRTVGFGSAEAPKTAWYKEWPLSLRTRWLGTIGVVAVLVVLSTWVLVHAWNAHQPKAAQAAGAVSPSSVQSQAQNSTSSVPRPAGASLRRVGPASSAGSDADWRVIAFTYNRREDAAKKAASLAGSHPDLQATVFSPTGHAPYLVSIGGVMDRDAAYALARRSRSMGLPHDTYAQNYRHGAIVR